MALVATVVQKDQIVSQFDSSKRLVQATVAFDASYVAGGMPVTLSQLGLRTIDKVYVFPSQGYTFEYDPINTTILAYSAAGVEVVAAVDLSALTSVEVIVVGDIF